MRKGHTYYRRIQQNYSDTYFLLGLGYITTIYGERVRNGFLYQEPNPKYDLWLPENCTPILFEDWLKDKIPEGMPKPKPGPKSKSNIIVNRPFICVETGEIYMSLADAEARGLHKNVTRACKRLWFHDGKRYTYLDPFMPWDNEPWPWKKWGIHSPKSHMPANNTHPVILEKDGEQHYFRTAQSACEFLHTYHQLLLDAIRGGYPICGGWIVKEAK